MTLELCRQCDGVVCSKVQLNVYIKKDNQKAPEIVIGTIENCPKRKEDGEESWEEVQDWFNLYGKIDTMHLGS
jgi:hypothetical protein